MATHYDESEVMKQLAQGSEVAFNQVFHHYQARVFKTVLDYVKIREAAQEILQEVFTIVWTKRQLFGGQVQNPGAYIFVIARNLTLNYLAKLSKEQLAYYKYAIRHSRVDNTTERYMLENENDHIYQQTLDLLTPQQRQIFQLSRHEGLSHDDIAHQLKLSPWTVSNHVKNALKIIRQRLQPHIGFIAFIFFGWN